MRTGAVQHGKWDRRISLYPHKGEERKFLLPFRMMGKTPAISPTGFAADRSAIWYAELIESKFLGVL